MIPKRDINLSSKLDSVLNYNDPRLTDRKFEKALVRSVYSSIVSSWTYGTDDAGAYDRAKEVAQRRVEQAIAANGIANRDKVCSALFNPKAAPAKAPEAPKPRRPRAPTGGNKKKAPS